MSARPLFLGGQRRADFASTEGHTEPAVVTVPGVRVLGDDGSRLDLHRVTAANDWLSDDELADLTDEQREEARRAETRERLRMFRAEAETTHRQWMLWAAALAAAIVGSAIVPEHWGAGWHVGALLDLLP